MSIEHTNIARWIAEAEADLAAGRTVPLADAFDSLDMDGWLAPRRSRVALVERSRGFLHLWVGPFGLHLARPLHRSRLDFCSDWWR